MSEKAPHQPVLLAEVIEEMVVNPAGNYIDATLGRGGHSRAILAQLNENGRLLAIDQDWDAIAYAQSTFKDERFTMVQGSFANIDTIVAEQGWQGQVDGILFDLGVSSPQLDTAERGFSFQKDGPLDMRMDVQAGTDAGTWLQEIKEEDLRQVIREFGEERFAKRIANAIVTAREESPITRTLELAAIVKKAIPRWEPGKHPATRTFQAIRIAINEELTALKIGLGKAFTCLRKSGRLAVITFHSLEDRIVKNFYRELSGHGSMPSDLPIRHAELKIALKQIGRGIKPSAAEIALNPRARSAKLRLAERLL